MDTDDGSINKSELYGRYQRGEDARHKLGLKMAYKSLDIPDDDMNINANRTVNGVGAKAMIGVAVAAGIPAALVAGALLLRPAEAPQKPPAPTVPVVTPAAEFDTDAIYEQQQKDGTWKEIKRERLR